MRENLHTAFGIDVRARLGRDRPAEAGLVLEAEAQARMSHRARRCPRDDDLATGVSAELEVQLLGVTGPGGICLEPERRSSESQTPGADGANERST